MFKKIFSVLLGVLFLFCMTAGAQTIATVNGKAIPASQVEAFVKQEVEQGQTDTPELRASLKEDLIMREILVQEANRKKLGSLPEVKTQIDNNTKAILVHALKYDFMKRNPVKDNDIKAEYDRLVSRLGKTEYHARHILVHSESDAQKIIEQINNGAKFEDMAQQYSKDTGSAKNGGNLNWAPPSNFVKPFADALAALGKDEMTKKPVQTQYGFHIIKVDDIRELKIPSFEEAKPRVQNGMLEKKFQAYLETLRKNAKVK